MSQLAQVSTFATVRYRLTYLSFSNNYLTTESIVSRDPQCSSSQEKISNLVLMYYLRQAFLVVIKEGFLLTGEIKATHQF